MLRIVSTIERFGGPIRPVPEQSKLRAASQLIQCAAVPEFSLDARNLERLLEASRLATLGRLLPSLLHQLSTPLAAVALRIEGLERALAAPEATAGREKTERYLRAMGEETRRCRDLLAAVRDFTSVGDRGPSPVDLSTLCRGAVTLVQHEAMRRQVTVEAGDASVPTVRGERYRLAQAVLALVTNAVEASPDGGRVEVAARLEGASAVVTVTDQGGGVPEDVRARLFEPFATTREPSQGLGLGLLACRAIAEAHGGSLALQPGKAGGSRLALSLPVQGGDVEGGRGDA
jgi:two-component system NtrC family sensor kinase